MRASRLTFALLFFGVLAAPARPSDLNLASDTEALTLAQQILDKGAELYNAKDAQGLAATYTEDAEVHALIKKQDETKTDVKRGRFEIEQVYRDIFKDAGSIKAKNTVEYARLLDSDMLLIVGYFEPDAGTMKVPFVQVRIKKGEKWLMSSLRLFIVEKQ